MPYRLRSTDRPTTPPREVLVFVCQGPSCGERGGARLLEQLRDGTRLAGDVPLRSQACASTCMNSCATGPNVLVAEGGTQLTGTTLESLTAHLQTLAPGPAERSAPDAP